MRLANNIEDGFSLVEVILCFLVVAGIFLVGILVYQRHNDKTTIISNAVSSNTISKSTIVGPVLGNKWNPSPDLKGYGTVMPSTLAFGGDVSGLVKNITWQSWGGLTATGTGKAEYIAPGDTPPQGVEEVATIVAFNLGVCGGKSAYNSIDWYFPQHRQSFKESDGTKVCSS